MNSTLFQLRVIATIVSINRRFNGRCPIYHTLRIRIIPIVSSSVWSWIRIITSGVRHGNIGYISYIGLIGPMAIIRLWRFHDTGIWYDRIVWLGLMAIWWRWCDSSLRILCLMFDD